MFFSQAVEAGFEVIDPEETGLGGEGMKSAAQKRKEKKERQKQKEEKKPEPPASTATVAPVEAPTAVVAEAKTGGEREVIVRYWVLLRFDQDHRHPKQEVRRLTCPGWESIPGLQGGRRAF